MDLWRLLAKHQSGAVIATLVDFAVMIAWVEIGSVSPVTATAIGAASGALTSFLFGRQWIFRVPEGAVHGQAFRYALVSTASLGLNSIGEHLLLRFGAPYL